MSRVNCGEPSSVPCRCDPVTGCGHLSSWHRVYERWVAACTVPDCACRIMDACDCVAGLDGEQPLADAKVLAEMGIAP